MKTRLLTGLCSVALVIGVSGAAIADAFDDGLAVVEAAYGQVDQIPIGGMENVEAHMLLLQALDARANGQEADALAHLQEAIQRLGLQ